MAKLYKLNLYVPRAYLLILGLPLFKLPLIAQGRGLSGFLLVRFLFRRSPEGQGLKLLGLVLGRVGLRLRSGVALLTGCWVGLVACKEN